MRLNTHFSVRHLVSCLCKHFFLNVFHRQVLGDEGKRREYDTLGQAFGGAGAGAGGFQGQWQSTGGGNIDPEELFRKIFGDQGFGSGGGGGGGGFGSIFEDFGGFSTGHEVIVSRSCFLI